MDAPLVSMSVVWLFAGLLLWAAISDIRTYRIPNRIVVALAILYPAHVLSSPVLVDWLGGLMFAAVCFAVGLVLFVRRLAGGGDVKLLVATAFWVGPSLALEFLFVTTLVGGLMALAMSVTQVRFGLALAFEAMGGRRMRDVVLGDILPYGVAIAAGGLLIAAELLGGSAP